MNLLSIDTSGHILSVAASNGDDIHYIQADTAMKHSELVMEFIDTQMKKASLKQSDLNAVLCMKGPGSFTGLRIGYSIAKGLALALSIPFIPVPTLDCISYGYDHLVLAVIEARKNAFFYAFFQDGKQLTPIIDADNEQIKNELSNYKDNITLIGPGSYLLYESLPVKIKNNISLKNENMGFAKEIILVAKSKSLLYNTQTEDLFSGPEYFRKTDAELGLE